MEELIAKRYIKALKGTTDTASLEVISSVLSALAASFKNFQFVQIVNNPNVSKNEKEAMLLAAVASAKSTAVENLIKLLVENNRINIIPALAEVMRKDIANTTKTYSGVVYSDQDIDAKVIEQLSSNISSKLNSKITLTFVKNDFNGIKVDVEDLGVEIDFSKSRINGQITEHILKAI